VALPEGVKLRDWLDEMRAEVDKALASHSV
jgi:hypothetical protein